MSTQTLKPYLSTKNDSAFRFFGLATAMHASTETTGGAFGLVEHWDVPRGFATPYHTHRQEDESFYILEGEVAFVCDGQWLKAGPGNFVFGPRNIPHGFQVVSTTPARLLLLCSPSGFEKFVQDLSVPLSAEPVPPDMGVLMTVAAKYQIDIHGPLPEIPAELQSTSIDLKNLNHIWIQAFNDRDWKTERAIRGENFQAYLSGSPEPMNNDAWSGFMTAFTTAFPDSRITIDSCIAEGDQVVCRWTLTGTQKGEFQGIPPSGRAVRFTGIELNRVENGRLVEHHSQFDLVSVLHQIGAMGAAT